MIFISDFQPQNIFFSLEKEKVKIGDFGLAKALQDDEPHLASVHSGQHTSGLGTVMYRAPEQVSNLILDSIVYVQDTPLMSFFYIYIITMLKYNQFVIESCLLIRNILVQSKIVKNSKRVTKKIWLFLIYL